jgi:hypothetical protein
VQLKLTHTFDAPLKTVYTARLERFNHLDKIQGLKKPNYLSFKEDEKTITTVRAFEAADNAVPAPIKKMLSEDMFKFVETSTLDKQAFSINWKVEPKAKKDQLIWKGFTTFTEKNGVVERVIDATIKVKVPFIGDQMEKSIASGFKKSMEKDYSTICAMIELMKKGEV